MRTLETVRDLLSATGLSGSVSTRGYYRRADGAGMEWRIASAPPAGALGLVSVPTADGGVAVPTGLPSGPPRPAQHSGAVSDLLRRAYTFRDEGGTDLRWNAQRQGPGLSRTPVHSSQPKPYPVTCSHFVGMVLAGWEYRTTTYVADSNTRTGWYVPLGVEPRRAEIWQAHRLARLLFVRGDLWFTDGTDIERGDLLFFAEKDPERSYERVRTGAVQPYFGNVYHVAINLGGGRLLQSATPTSPTGVYETEMYRSLRETLCWAARPAWTPPQGTAMSAWIGQHECPLAPAR